MGLWQQLRFDKQIFLNLGSNTRKKSTRHGKTPELCWICSPNIEIKSPIA